MNADFLTFLSENGVDATHMPETEENLFLFGTLVTKDSASQDVKVQLLYENGKWKVDILDGSKLIKTLPLPLPDLTYHCTFMQLHADNYIYSSDSKALAAFCATVAWIQKNTSIPSNNAQKDSLFIALMADRNMSKVRLLHSFLTQETGFTFLKNPNPLELYQYNHGLYSYCFCLIPFVGYSPEFSRLPDVPCLYPSVLPEDYFPEDNTDAIPQAIHALGKRIEQSKQKLEVAQETPLELVKQKMQMDVERNEVDIKLQKQKLINTINDQKTGVISRAIKLIAPNIEIANNLDFHRMYSVSGSDISSQILKIIESD